MWESEELFETVFQKKEIIFEKIPVAESLTPDYKISLGDTNTYWEIKALEVNPAEKAILKNIDMNEPESYSTDSSRVADSIKKASRQLKEYSAASDPCVVVLYDSRPFFVKDFMFTGCVQTIMHGPAEYKELLNGELVNIRKKYGLLTPNRKNHISAIAILYKHTMDLTFFHNRNANNSLRENKILSKFDEHYSFEETDTGLEWKKILQGARSDAGM